MATHVKNDLMRINEVAELFGVGRGIIYRWVKAGKLPYISIINGPEAKREIIRFERRPTMDYYYASKHRKKNELKLRREYNIPGYVMDYLIKMVDEHRSTPGPVVKFVEKYKESLTEPTESN